MDINKISKFIVRTSRSVNDLINKWGNFTIVGRTVGDPNLDLLHVLRSKDARSPIVITRSSNQRVNNPSLRLAETEILGRINLS